MIKKQGLNKINEDELECLNHRAAYWKIKCSKLKDYEVIDAVVTEKAAQLRLSGEVELLESENLELRETVNELMAANEAEILTFEKGKYYIGGSL